MRFTKLPVTIDAMRWSGSPEDAAAVVLWVLNNDGKAHYQSEPRQSKGKEGIIPPHIMVETLDSKGRVFAGDYVIRGIHGEFYPCDEAVFVKSYRPATEEDEQG